MREGDERNKEKEEKYVLHVVSAMHRSWIYSVGSRWYELMERGSGLKM